MAIYRDTGVFCLSITGTKNFQYRPLLSEVCKCWEITDLLICQIKND